MALLGLTAACGQAGGTTGAGAGSPAAHTASPRPSASAAATAVALPAPVACPAPVAAAAPVAAPIPASPVAHGAVVATIPTPFSPQGFAVGEGSVWVITHRSTDVYRIDPATNRAVDIKYTTTLPDSGAFDIAAGPHGVWFAVGHEDAVDRVDTAANTAAPFAEVTGAEWVIDTPAGVWVASTDETAQRISEIDPGTGKVTRTMVVGGGGTLDSDAVFLAYGAGSLWVTRQDDPRVLIRVDPVAARVTAVVALPAANLGAVAGPSAVYVSLGDNSVARVDPATDCVTAVRPLGPAADAPVFIPVDAQADAVRVTYAKGAAVVLDPATLKVVRAYRVDDQQYEGGLVSAFGSTWFSTFNHDTVVRLKD